MSAAAETPLSGERDEAAYLDEQFTYRADGIDLVTAQGSYIADILLPGMVDAAFVRSPVARATIRSIDLQAASQAAGVIRVATGADIARSIPRSLPWASKVLHPSEFASEKFNLPSYRLLPDQAVHHEGECVAVVVAENRYKAEDAAELVDVRYDEQPPVLDPEFSLSPGCDRIYPDVPGNLALEGQFGSKEEPGAVFKDSALVLRRRYRMNRSGNPPLETGGVIAQFERGRLTVWSTSQRPHMLRVALADILGLPASRVRVISAQNIGGGFGWKSPMYRETAVVAWLAMQCGRPVRWIEDRTEALKKGVHERDQIWDLTAAFDARGKLLALDADIIADVGCVLIDMYGLLAARLSATVPSPYDIPWIRSHLRCAVTHKAPMGVNRPAGRMPGVWAIERLMDDAARELGMSGFEIRLANLVREFPYASPLGSMRGGKLTDSDYLGSMTRLAQVFRLDERREEARRLRAAGRKVGVGVAACVELCRPTCSFGGAQLYNQPTYAAVSLRMHPDGSLSVLSGDAPQGQQRHTTMARIISGELGIDPKAIEVYTGDTLLSPLTQSNTDVATVCAIAARRLRAKIIAIASHLLKAPPIEANFICRDSVVTYAPDGRAQTFGEIAWAAIMRPFLMPDGQVPDLAETAYFETEFSPTSFGAHAAMVEVDAELGKLRILSYGFVSDSGKPLNPRGLRTALIAGIATGIGGTTHEAYIYDDQGQLITSSLKDYTMLGAGEMPEELILAHHDTPTSATIYGHKRMISEGVASGVPPAIANAIIDAFDGGIDLRVIPFFPSDLWRAANAPDGADPGAAR
jgi:carbon-monoxide dehydrogenase large subunit